MTSSSGTKDAPLEQNFASLPPRPDAPLRARTLELLWHCHERNEEAERYGLVQAAQTPEGVLSIDYTPTEGGRLVTTGGDMCVRLWKVDEAAIANWLVDTVCDMAACCRFLATMRTSWMPLTARWSPHGQLIASAHCEGKICLWWRDQNSAVNHRAENTTTTTTSSASTDLVEEEWKDYRHLSGHISDVHDLCFSPDSRYLLSGAGDGSIVIHDLDGSPMPIIQLTDVHSKFCRGVAWDPWGRYIHTFGCGPALQYFTVVPRREKTITEDAARPRGSGCAEEEETHTTASAEEDSRARHSGSHAHAHHQGRRVRQMQLVNQRRCQGDFIGESCALSFRRLEWSPDGTLLAVPFGKLSRQAESTSASSDQARRSAATKNTTTDALFAAIDARRSSNGVEEKEEKEKAPQESQQQTQTVAEEATEVDEKSDRRAEDMLHCVQIYVRGAMDAPAVRLTVRGYSEIRGVQWAPCFLTPVFPSPFVTESAANDAQASPMNGMDVEPVAAPEETNLATATTPGCLSAACCSASAELSSSPRNNTPAATRCTTTKTTTVSANGHATATVNHTQNPESWSLSDYRMALAVWTSDAVIVYTTDQLVRHSDYTDLHMRSITDVAWNATATYLFTSALDGYVSVLSVGDSLAVAYRVPSFSSRPMTRRLTALLERIDEEGRSVEGGRVARRETARLAAENASRVSKEAGSGAAEVVVVRKKKKVENKSAASALTEVQVDQLEALMSGL